MRRTGRADGFRHLQVRVVHHDLSFEGKEAKAPAVGTFLYVCKNLTCEEPTRLRRSDNTPQKCHGVRMMCRKVRTGGDVDTVSPHAQNIWACTTCEVTPARIVLPPEHDRGCTHEFVVYATNPE